MQRVSFQLSVRLSDVHHKRASDEKQIEAHDHDDKEGLKLKIKVSTATHVASSAAASLWLRQQYMASLRFRPAVDADQCYGHSDPGHRVGQHAWVV